MIRDRKKTPLGFWNLLDLVREYKIISCREDVLRADESLV
jgi:hypothetical protein